MMYKDENILIEKIKESDFDAFHDFYYQYQPVLYKHILFMTKDQDLTKDLVQETFYRIWMNRKSLKPKSSFYGYISRICSNLLKDYYRHEKVKQKHQDSAGETNPAAYQPAEESLEAQLLKEEVRKIINKYLSPKRRMIFILSRIEGYSNDEIVRLLKISKKTVEYQLFRALQIIRKKLSNYYK
jgi:RNA polymerase sigma-70 factor (family 1)